MEMKHYHIKVEWHKNDSFNISSLPFYEIKHMDALNVLKNGHFLIKKHTKNVEKFCPN